MPERLSTVEIKPSAEHRYSVIWLHGLGADGHDFEAIVPELKLQAEAHIHFIFPNAPIRPITINGGMEMRGWFDILELSRNLRVDAAGIAESVVAIRELVDEQIAKGIPAHNILLAGFSQGGAIALKTALSYSERIAGVVALSTFLPTMEQMENEHAFAHQDLPIFMGHGILDSIIAIELGKQTANRLQEHGYAVEWHDYMMSHSVCIEEIQHIAKFINAHFLP